MKAGRTFKLFPARRMEVLELTGFYVTKADFGNTDKPREVSHC